MIALHDAAEAPSVTRLACGLPEHISPTAAKNHLGWRHTHCH